MDEIRTVAIGDSGDVHSDGQGRGPSRLAVRLAWAVLLIAGGLVAAIQLAGAAMGTPESARLATPAEYPSVQLEQQVRVSLGMEAVLGAMAEAQTATSIVTLDEMVEGSLLDRLRLTAGVAELAGGDVALSRLESLEGDVIGAASGALAPADGSGEDPEDVRAALLRDVRSLRVIYTDGAGALEADAAAALVDRHGWFGELAMTHGADPATDSSRREIESRARRAAMVMIAVVGAGLIGLAIGYALLVLFIILLAIGVMKRRYPELQARFAGGHSVYLETMALFIVAFLAQVVVVGGIAAIAGASVAEHASFVLIWMITPLAVLWPMLRGESWSSVRDALGLRAPRGVAVEMLSGVAGYVAGLPIIAVGLGIVFLLVTLLDVKPTHPAMEQAAGAHDPWTLIRLYLLAAVWAPVTEELFFRGAFYHHLRQRFSFLTSGVLVAVVFAMLHPQGIAVVPGLMSIALVFSFMREVRGSVYPSMLAHGLHNGVLVTMVVLMG